MKYELAVCGNDAAAFTIATAAAKRGHRVLLVIPENQHSAWLCTQAMRRIVTSMLADGFCLHNRLQRRMATPGLLARLLKAAIVDQLVELTAHLDSALVDVVFGESRIIESGCLAVHSQVSGTITLSEAHAIVIGTGIRWASSRSPFGVLPTCGPEFLLTGTRLPSRATILGGHSFGLILASLLSQVGVRSTVMGDMECDDVHCEIAQACGVRLFGEHFDEGANLADVLNGVVIDCQRIVGLTSQLNLRTIGVEPDENGRLWCDENLQTWGRGIYGIGDVVGFSKQCGASLEVQANRIMDHVQRYQIASSKRVRSTAVARFVPGRVVLATSTGTE